MIAALLFVGLAAVAGFSIWAEIESKRNREPSDSSGPTIWSGGDDYNGTSDSGGD